uniref:CUB domain-containing protein n=1 Tax=Pristionchus pacificus TaxID=54126 RepID=A0A8R1Z774_PRIPA
MFVRFLLPFIFLFPLLTSTSRLPSFADSSEISPDPSDSCSSIHGISHIRGEPVYDPMTFSSPNYPLQYLSKQDCIRVIRATKGYEIHVIFRNYFQIERTYDRRGVFNENHVDCPNDYLELRDGPYGFSPLIGRYCGNSLPREDIRATSGYMWIRFHSDDALEYGGFTATYEFRMGYHNEHPNVGGCHFDLSNELDGEIETTTAISALLEDPSLRESECVWKVQVPSNLRVWLNIDRFSLGEPNQCASNFLEIYTGNTFDKPVKRLCGASAASIFTSHHTLFLRLFTLNSTIRRNTFISANYSAYARHKNCSMFSLYSCGDENCIPHQLVCNSRINCPYQRDEQFCEREKTWIVKLFHLSYFPLILIISVVFIIITILVLWTTKFCRCHKKERSTYLTELSSRPPPGIVMNTPLSALSTRNNHSSSH